MVAMSGCRAVCVLALAVSTAVRGFAGENDPVTGRVLDPGGRPVGAATVYLVLQSFTSPERNQFRQVKTGPDGTYSLPALTLGKAQGRLGVLAVKEGYGAWGSSLDPQGPRSGIEIRLAPPVELSGTVRDAAGKPIPGVKVRVGSGTWSGWFGLPDNLEVISSTTDASGRFRLRGLADEAKVNLDFRHPRYARWGRFVDVSQRPDLTVQLRRSTRVVGRVIYGTTRRPAAGIRVACRYEGETRDYAPYGRGVTDKNGRFHFDDLAPGSYLVYLDYYGDKPLDWVANASRVEHVPEGKEGVCEALLLNRGGFVTGRVTDRVTGQPIAEAQVGASRSQGNRWEPGPNGKTRADGTYRLRVPPGKWQIATGGREGYLPPWQEQRGVTQDRTTVNVAADQTVAGPNFTLLPGVELKGIVLDPDGRPDPRATIWGRFFWDTPVRPDGTFVLKGLRPDQPVQFTVRGSDRTLKAFVDVTPRKGATEPVTIRLARGMPVTGKVVDDRGRPLPGAQARAECRLDIGDGGWMMAAIDTARTDDQGRFTLWLLPGTEHEVKASAAGYSAANRPGILPDPKEADLGIFTLTGAHLAISGRVTDAEGKPLGGVRVSAGGETQNSNGWNYVLTDAQGRFRIENLATGKVQLDVQGADHGFEFREVEAGASGVDIVLLPEQNRYTLPAKSRLKPGDAAPEIAALRPLNGGRVPRLGALRGRIVLLQFATPHNPAVEACSERLDALQRKYARAGVTLVTIYDASLPASETAAYLKTRGVTSPAAIVPPTAQLGWNSAPFKRYDVRAVPALFLIDRSGRVRAVGSSVAELEPAIERLARSR